MGLVHTARTVAALARGLWNNRSSLNKNKYVGLLEPYRSERRVGLSDVDYLGHMNNAAYLTQAELVRWELTAANGLLSAMVNLKATFMVTSTHVRFRKEIRPIYSKFQVDTILAGLDERYMLFLHNFRQDHGRIRAQVMVQAVVVRNGTVLDPREFLIDAGFDPKVIGSVSGPNSDAKLDEMFERYEAVEESLREAAAEDDNMHK